MSQTQRECMNHYRCGAIVEVLWMRSRIPELSKYLKIGDSYLIEAKQDFLSFALSFLGEKQHLFSFNSSKDSIFIYISVAIYA